MPMAKLKPKGQITIPKQVRDQLGLSEGDLVEIAVQGGRGIIMPQRVVPAAPVPRLSAKEQQALARARKKIAAMREDLASSRGLTEDEAKAAAKAGLIAADQRWWWTEEWQEGEREVERNYQDSNYRVFENAEEFLANLKAL